VAQGLDPLGYPFELQQLLETGCQEGLQLNMTQPCVLAAQQASRALGCIPSSVGTGRGRGFCPSALLC